MGSQLKVEIRSQPVAGKVVPTPFYKRPKKGLNHKGHRESQTFLTMFSQEPSRACLIQPEYKYTKEHEWIKADGKSATIGITHHAQESLGDIVFVELPKSGPRLQRARHFGSVESVKAVSDLYAPASGTVTEVNGELATAPKRLTRMLTAA